MTSLIGRCLAEWGGLMQFGVDWTAIREWGGFVASVTVALFVAYDLWWVRRPRLRIRMHRYHNSDRLYITVINRGGGPLVILNVYFEDSPQSGIGIVAEWVPDDGTLPVSLSGGSAVDWRPEVENPLTMVLAGVPFGKRYFKIPEPGWKGKERRFRRGEVFDGMTKELKGQRKRPTPERPLEFR